jgi:uncharacterized protein (DUF58 family)
MNSIKYFIPLFIIILAFVLFVGGIMPYFLLYILLLAFLVPLVHSLIILKKIKGNIRIPKGTLYAGNRIILDYQINNNSRFYIPHMEIQSHISKQLTGIDSPKVNTSLNPKESFTHRETLVLKRRGYYELGEIEVNIQDVFGIYKLKRKIRSKTSLLVYPETVDLSSFIITAVEQSGELLVEDPAFQDRSRISSLRNYREGDSVKSIHWKLSAKLDHLVIKDYENRGDTHVAIFIDNYQKLFSKDIDRRLEDKAAEVALSIVNYYISQNIPVSFQTQYEEELVHIEGQQKSHIKPFMDFLARFKGNGAMDFNSFLNPKIDIITKDTTVIIITPNLDKSMGTLGILLKTKNLKPLFIVVTDKENNTGNLNLMVQESLRQEGVPIYLLDYKSNIKEVLEEQYG